MKKLVQYELFKREILKDINDNTNLKRMDMLTLFYLEEINKKEVYVRQLRELMHNPPSSEVTGSLKKLEDLAYFNKVRDKEDERAIILKNIDLEKVKKTLEVCIGTIDQYVEGVENSLKKR